MQGGLLMWTDEYYVCDHSYKMVAEKSGIVRETGLIIRCVLMRCPKCGSTIRYSEVEDASRGLTLLMDMWEGAVEAFVSAGRRTRKNRGLGGGAT